MIHHWIHHCLGHDGRKVCLCWCGGGGAIGCGSLSVFLFLAGFVPSYGTPLSFFRRMPTYLLSPMGTHTLSFPSETICQSSGFTPLMNQ